MSDSFRPHGLYSPWNFPSQNTGVGSFSFSRGSSQLRDQIRSLELQAGSYQLGHKRSPVAAAAKLLQSCPTLCDPIDGSPTGSTIPGILQARILEWVAIPFSNAWKWKVEVKSLSRVRLSATPWTADYQAPPSMGFSRQEYHCLLPNKFNKDFKNGPHQKKKKQNLKTNKHKQMLTGGKTPIELWVE